MSKSTAMMVSAVGVIALLVSASADYVGLGAGAIDFGEKQIIGTIVGALILVVGLVMMGRAKSSTN